MKPQSTLKLRASTLAVAAGFVFSALPPVAEAAGLGKVTVFSAIGQPLRAEVELAATPEELSSMKASLASEAAFKTAGLDYASTLQTLRFSIDKGTGGKPIIRLSSERPVNDPFIDMLLEVNWASGRLVREYTFLLDPPEMMLRAQAPVTTPAAKPAAMAPVERSGSMAPRAAVMPAAAGEAPSGEYKVKRGDTLRKIATANQHDGVSLEQMLVGLFNANKDAFDGGNMNRLRSGRILTIPEKSAVESVSEADAHKVIAVQAADWNAYRRKLAAATAQSEATDEAGRQAATGKITARVEEKAAPSASTKDQVRVSKTETGPGKPGTASGEEELIAKDKALREANERLAMLEKNVADLQKLLEMRNQSLAELQKQAGQAPAAAAAATRPEPVKPVETPKAEAPKVEAPKVEAPKVEAPKVEAPKVEAPKPEAPKPEAKKPAPKPKPKVIPPPPPEEPSFVEELMGNPMLLAGGGGVLALLLAFVAIKRRRAAAAEEVPLDMSTADLSQGSGLSENSVFRTTGGQSVDTSHTPPQTDFSQAGPGTIDTDEVDPVAEADVYMAYGRDAQAEEILLEAKAKDPKRHAVHLKLLEIYANRQSNAQFEALATELYGDTGGAGGDWDKAAAMGRKLDPQNPLYGGGGAAVPAPAAAPAAPAAPAFDSNATLVVSAETMKNTVATAAAAPVAEAPAAAAEAEPVGLDFDLGPAVEAEPVEAAAFNLESTLTQPGALHMPEEEAAGGGLDFDIGGAAAQPAEPAPAAEAPALDFEMPEIELGSEQAAEPETPAALDFDIGLDTPAAEPVASAAPEAAPAAADEHLEFDVNLTESTVLGEAIAPPAFDMTTINLDLDEAKPSAMTESAFEAGQMATMVNPDLVASLTGQDAPDDMGGSDEVSTKLDLAKAYEEMGDLEGARELLQEVLQEGNATQQEAARATLERIGS